MRLFVAVEIPPAMRAEVGRVQDRLRGECRGWKWVSPGSVHLTLRFLGDVFPADAQDQSEHWRLAAAHVEPFRFRLEGVGVFPSRRKPRILWAGIAETGGTTRLSDLAGRFETAARSAGFEAEERPFHPHLTLARAERDGHSDPPPADIALEPVETACSEVILFRSELRPEGARYTPLSAFPLRGAGRA